MYTANKNFISQIISTDPKFDKSIEEFKDNYYKNLELYTSIATEAGLPSEVVAVIHWRERTGDLNSYLHNGDPLGKPTVNEPKNIPVFDNFKEAAVHSLTYDSYKNAQKQALQLTTASDDFIAMMTYLEVYNGAGYYKQGLLSAYLYNGTNIKTGKYTSDGVFEENPNDLQPGAYLLLKTIISGGH